MNIMNLNITHTGSGISVNGEPHVNIPVESDHDQIQILWYGYLSPAYLADKHIETSSSQRCAVVQVGTCTTQLKMYFPRIYLINFDATYCAFMTNMMKFGVDAVKISRTVDGDVVCIHGNSAGQSEQWERYSVDGSYLDHDGFCN
jgi:hypothetical protein